MHNMRKTIGELHALLIKCKKGLPKKATTPQVMAIQSGRIQKANKKSLNAKGKGLPKKATTPQVMAIQSGRIQKANKKSLNAKGKEHSTKDDTCHHCKEVGHCKRNCPAYLAELIKKKKQVGTASSLVSKNNVLCFNVIPSNGIYEIDMLNLVPNVWGCEALVKRDTPDKLQQVSVKCIFIGYPKEMIGYNFYFPPKNKNVVAWYAKFLKKNLLSQDVSEKAEELEEVVPVRRSTRTHRAPDHLYLNAEVKEHSLGDLNEPANYKAAILDPESDKWVDAMNAKMQPFKMDNSKHSNIPMQERFDLNKTQGASPEEVKRMQNIPYASANRGKPHWSDVETILKYLRNTKDMFLVYGGYHEAEL
nr:hypothetical protein [Tanacetum cinerariifolium]